MFCVNTRYVKKHKVQKKYSILDNDIYLQMRGYQLRLYRLIIFIFLALHVFSEQMDENGDGAIAFDEWLGFSISQIFSQV